MHLTESFASGSHVFGNSIDDVHSFTGSIYLGELPGFTSANMIQLNAAIDSYILFKRDNDQFISFAPSSNATTHDGHSIIIQSDNGYQSEPSQPRRSGGDLFLTSGRVSNGTGGTPTLGNVIIGASGSYSTATSISSSGYGQTLIGTTQATVSPTSTSLSPHDDPATVSLVVSNIPPCKYKTRDSLVQ